MIEVKIPRKALAIMRYDIPVSTEGEDSKDRKILPEANDPIDFRAEGVVKSVDGETCTVEIRFINGERPEMEKKAEKADETKDEGDALRTSAEESDAAASEEEE